MPKNAAHTEKLLMRIRSVKWHAATTASSSHRAAARAGAAAIVVDLEAMEVAARAPRTEGDSTAGELQVDSLSDRLTRLGPQWLVAPPDLSSLTTISGRASVASVPFTALRGTTPPALLLGSGGCVSDPRQRADDARRAADARHQTPSDHPEPAREKPTERPEDLPAKKTLADAVIDADDAQLVDPAAEPGKPV
jgi:hypothetical protein